MERSDRRVEQKKYGLEQMELLRILLEEEKCTVDMIHSLTGIPTGSLSMIRKELNLSSSDSPGFFGGGQINAIRRARRVSVLREKYAQQISILFPKKAEG